jgi:hypothetical protein
VPGRVGDVRLQLGRLTVRRGAAKRAPSRALQLRGRRSGFCISTWLNHILSRLGGRRSAAAASLLHSQPSRNRAHGELVPGRVGDVRLQLGRLTVRRGAAKRAPSRAPQLRGRRSGFCISTWLNHILSLLGGRRSVAATSLLHSQPSRTRAHRHLSTSILSRLGGRSACWRRRRRLRESVLFIGTQFSILYTFVYSPA